MANVKLSFGPMLIGTYMNMILYGILIVQALFYFQTYKKDAPWIRYLVLYLFLVETINTGCDIAMMYQPLIMEYGQPDAVKFFPTMFASEPVVIVAVSTPIQLFFAWRIWALTKSIWIPIIVSLFALVSFAGGIWTAAKIVIIRLFALKPELHEPALVWFLASCISDVCITAVLVFSLSKRKTGFAATDDALSKIIRLTVQTGLITSLFAIGDVVFFMTLPHTGLNFLWDLALSKLYSNCLLSTLNARASLSMQSGGASRPRGLGAITGHSTFARRPQSESGLEDGLNETQYSYNASFHELDSPRKPSFGPSLMPSDGGYGITVTKAS
ncbi:hypothetical protein AX14_001835 [Amanita brunnescens Koide BX004]|nr:hypothetical protein AX14_001835 [Amanita brunnescens Koide BX004]